MTCGVKNILKVTERLKELNTNTWHSLNMFHYNGENNNSRNERVTTSLFSPHMSKYINT